MAEAVSPESKLYVKEEIEKSRKEFKEDLKQAQSKATKTFTTVALIIGLLASVGVYGLAKDYMSTTIQTTIDEKLGKEAVAEFEKRKSTAKKNMSEAERLISDANDNLQEILHLKKIAHLPIGTVLQSMLDPNSFAAAVGDPCDFDPEKSKWVLADGRDVTNSRYVELTGEPNTPDLRGMFLRGVNEGRPNADPEINRKVGSFQDDALQQHGHWTDAFKLPSSWTGRRDTDPLGYTKTGDADALPASVKDVVKITVEPRTAVETRPKNVAVYFYIKIN